MTDTGAYKDTYTILLEISKVWKEMSDIDQAALLELIAGKTRSNTAAALLSNTKDLEKAYESALNAEGSALAENEKYLDSIQGRIDLFNNSVQTMWSNTLDSETVKNVVDFGTTLVGVIDNLGLVKTLLIAIGTYLMTKYDLSGALGGFFDSKTLKKATERLDLQKQLDTAYAKYDEGLNELGGSDSDGSKAIEAFEEIGELEEKIKKNGMSIEEANDAMEKFGDTTDGVGRNGIKAWDKLKTGAKKFGKQLANVAASMLTMYAITTALELVGKLWSSLNNWGKDLRESPEEAQEKFEELNAELSTAQSELNRLETELDTTQDRIDELMSMGTLSFVEQEELDNLRKQSAELEAQVELAKTLEQTLQNAVNLAAINASQKIFSDTSFYATDTKEERTSAAGETGQQIGTVAGFAIGKTVLAAGITKAVSAGGAAIGGKIGTALGSFAPGIGNAIGLAAGTIIGGLVGKWIGSSGAKKDYESEQTVDDVLNNMATERAKLEKTRDEAYKAYVADPENQKLKTQWQDAQAALGNYDTTLAQHISQMQQYLNSIDSSTLDNPADKAYYNQMQKWVDTYSMMMGGADAKSSIIARMFGDGAEGGFAKIKEQVKATTAETKELKEELTRLGKNGSVDLTIRPIVDASTMQKAGWDVEDGSISTVNTSTFTNEDETIAMNFTPILPNGEVLTPTELQEYAEAVIAGTREDDLGLKIGSTFSGEDAIAQAEDVAQTIHELHEKYFVDSKVDLSVLSDEEVERLREMGIYLYEIENYFKDVVKAESEFIDSGLEEVAKDINKITDGLGSLKSAFEEVIDEGVLTAKTIMSLKDELEISTTYANVESVTDAWREYLDIMMSGTATTEAMTQATERLAQSIIEAALADNNPTPENKHTYIAQLHRLGVTNAAEYVDDLLQKNMVKELEENFISDDTKLKDHYGRHTRGGKSFDELTDEEKREYAASYGLIAMSQDVIDDIKERYGVEEDAIDAINEKLMQRAKLESQLADIKNAQDVYNTWLNGDDGFKQVEEQVQAIKRQMESIPKYTYVSAKSVGKAETDAVGNLTGYYTYKGKSYWGSQQVKVQSKQYTNLQKQLDDLQKKYNEITAQGLAEGWVIKNEDGTYSLAEGVEAEFANAYAAAQQGVSDIQKEIDAKLTADVELKLDLQNKSELVDEIQSVYDTLSSAAEEYAEKGGAVSVDTYQQLLELEPKYLAMLYNEHGQITLNKDALYQVAQARLYDLTQKQIDTIITNATNAAKDGEIDKLKELTEVLYDAAQAQSEFNTQGLVGLRLALANEKLGLSEAEQTSMFNSVKSQVDAVIGAYKVSAGSIETLKKTLSSSSASETESALEALLKKYERKIKNLDNQQAYLENEIAILEAKGEGVSQQYYEKLIEIEEKKLDLYEQQRRELSALLNSTAEGSDEWSSNWYTY